MALTSAIELKELIFTVDDLVRLHETLIPKRLPEDSKYDLSISEKPTLTRHFNRPPKDLAATFNQPVYSFKLRYRHYKPDTLVVEMEIDSYRSYGSKIVIFGDDEDAVNSIFLKAQSELSRVTPQTTNVKRFAPLIISLIWIPLIYVILNLVRTEKNTIPIYWIVAVCVVLPMGLLGGLNGITAAYPSIEFQTGPEHFWRFKKRRKLYWTLISFFIVAPLGKVVYDLWRWGFTHQ